MKKSIILLIFLLLPTVYASSFTGIFTDYGNDTGTDGLFNYLTIQAGVSITDATKDYIIFGRLKDSQNNSQEYNYCYDVTSTGVRNFTLHFDGTELYRNKVNGPYALSLVELWSIPNCADDPINAVNQETRINAHTTKAYNYTQFQRGQAAIYCNNSPCIAPSSLIRSRDYLNYTNGTAAFEPNTPNTIDGCEDGSYGFYNQSESIENITVTSLNNTFFKTGDTVRVDIDVYCAYTFDKLNFVYSNDAQDINWVVKGTKQCPSKGFKTFSTTFNLGSTVEEHVVRGVFSFNLQPNTVCGQDDPQYQWADTDDVIINVKECNSQSDCTLVECDQLDNCYSGTYRDYQDIQNNCLLNFSCEQNSCGIYDEIITDIDEDNFDTECDNDCDDQNPDVNPGKEEQCNNGIDDDCDTLIDKNDPDCQGTYPIALTKGWNLLSLPKIDDNNISEIVKLFGADYDKIASLKEGKWHIYDRLDIINSNLQNLGEENGFWLEANKNTTIFINDEAAALTILNLKKGWNQIGYPSMEQKNFSLVFQDVMDDIELIYTYNNKFKSFNPNNPSNMQIKPGMGIFVKVKNDISWYFDTKFKKGTITYNLPLSLGWNAISLPLASNKTVSEIFGTTLYYLENSQWQQTEPTDYINYSHGYWLKSSTTSLAIEGYPINTLTYNIRTGWNLVNYPLTEEKSPSIWLQNVESNIDAALAYDNAWQTYIPGKSQNSLTMCKPGKALFIKAKNPEQWYFNGNDLVTT